MIPGTENFIQRSISCYDKKEYTLAVSESAMSLTLSSSHSKDIRSRLGLFLGLYFSMSGGTCS